MEYTLYTLISVLTGSLVGIIWFIVAKKITSKKIKFYLGFIYSGSSIFNSCLIITVVGKFLLILPSVNSQFEMNNSIEWVYKLITIWGFMSSTITTIIYIMCVVSDMILNSLKDIKN